MGGGELIRAGKPFAGDQDINGADEIGFMNLGDKLRARAGRSAEAVTDKIQKCVQAPSAVRTKGHGAADRDLARARRRRGEERLFPILRDLDGEVPGLRSARLAATELAIGLVHRAIERVPVD